MIERFAESMACYYAQGNYISQEELSSYKYGFEILLSTACNIALILIVSIFFQCSCGSLLYLVAFVLLRKVGGGYHSKSHRGCIITFAAIFILFCLINMILSYPMIPLYNLGCATVSAVIIWKVAPIEAPNKPLSPLKRDRYEKISLVIGCGFMFLALVIYLTSWTSWSISAYLFSGEIAAALSMAAAAIKWERRK